MSPISLSLPGCPAPPVQPEPGRRPGATEIGREARGLGSDPGGTGGVFQHRGRGKVTKRTLQNVCSTSAFYYCDH